LMAELDLPTHAVEQWQGVAMQKTPKGLNLEGSDSWTGAASTAVAGTGSQVSPYGLERGALADGSMLCCLAVLAEHPAHIRRALRVHGSLGSCVAVGCFCVDGQPIEIT
jgi:hypothetical protein